MPRLSPGILALALAIGALCGWFGIATMILISAARNMEVPW